MGAWPLRGGDRGKRKGERKGDGNEEKGRGGKLEQGRRMAKAGPAGPSQHKILATPVYIHSA